MKVTAILGSPKIEGSNTNKILDEYIRGLETNGHNVTKITLGDKTIAGCKGCGYCGFGERYCKIQDDMQKCYPLVEEADFIIFSTPVYWFSMTGQLKTFIDRCYALGPKVFAGKKIGLISTYGGENRENSGYSSIEDTMKIICKFLNMDFVLSYGIQSVSNEEKQKECLHKAFELGQHI